MYMTIIFTVFGIVAGVAGLLMPHLVHRLGFTMMKAYFGLALATALLSLLRRPPKDLPGR